MTFRQSIGRLLLKAVSTAFPVDPAATGAAGMNVDWLLSRDGGLGTQQTPAQLLRKYAGWVYACASISATSLASLPLKLYASREAGQEKARCKARRLSGLEDKILRGRFAGKALISQAEDIEEVLEHPLLDLLAHVNPTDNAFDLKEQTGQFLDLSGNALWYLKLNSFGQPEEIWPLQPDLVTLKRDPEKGVIGYLYGRPGDRLQQIKLGLDEVIHFRYPNPIDHWWGMGPVQAGIMAINRQAGMDVYEHSTLKNMGRPDIAVIYKGGQLQEDDRRELEIAWNNAYGGPDKAGKVRVMDEQYDVKEFGWSPREMAFLQGRNWTLKEIAAMFPVPVALLDTSQISLAPVSRMSGTAMFMAKYNTLPRARRIEEKLNERLCPLYDERLFLAFDNPVPDDVQAELQQDAALLNTYAITINEVRGKRGLEPVEWGNVPWAPMGLQPLGTPAPQPFSPLGIAPSLGSRVPKSEEQPGEAAGSQQIVEADGFPGGGLLGKGGEGSGNFGHEGRPGEVGGSGGGGKIIHTQEGNRIQAEILRAALHKEDVVEYLLNDRADSFDIRRMAEKVASGEMSMNEAVEKVRQDWELARGRARVAPKVYQAQFLLIKGLPLNGQFPALVEWKAKVGHVAPLSKSEKAFRAAMNDIFERQIVEARKNVERFVKEKKGTLIDHRKWVRETDQLILPLRWHPFKAGGDTALDAINFQLPEWIESKHVLDAIRNENFMFAREISTGTADRLQEELLEGMDAGETIAQLKDRIRGISEEWMEAGRAEMIARTESARAYSTGTTEAWRETDVVEGKVWLAAGDACPFCLAMNGTVVELDDNFKDLGDMMTVAGGGTMEFDYSAVGGPPLHPNCRCVLTAKLE